MQAGAKLVLPIAFSLTPEERADVLAFLERLTDREFWRTRARRSVAALTNLGADATI